jgi:hypothetical protein
MQYHRPSLPLYSDFRIWNVPRRRCVFVGDRAAGVGGAAVAGDHIMLAVDLRHFDRLVEGV